MGLIAGKIKETKSFFGYGLIPFKRNDHLGVHNSTLAVLCNSFQWKQQDGERMDDFCPPKPSAPTAQFWLNNVKMALGGMHFMEKVGTNPPRRKGRLIVSKRVIREELVFCFLKAAQGVPASGNFCCRAESTAPPLRRTYCHSSSLAWQGGWQQTGCFQWFCSESYICHYKIMLTAKPQPYVSICTLGRLLSPASI